MPNIRMPDGVVVHFPDDMPPDQIKSMISSKFPELGKPKEDDSADWYRGTVLPLATNQKTGERSAAVPGMIYEPYKAAERFLQGGQQAPSQNPDIIPDALTVASIFTPMNPAVRAGSRAIPGVAQAGRRPGAAHPAETLKGTAKKQLKQFRGTDIKVKPEAVNGFVATVRQQLLKDGFVEPDAASTYNILAALEKAPQGGWLSAEGIHSVRKSLGRVAGNYKNPSDQAAASATIQYLDEFFGALPEAGFLASTTPPKTAKAMFDDFRGNYAAAKQSEKITGKVEEAELRAAAANSGRNIDNQIRQRIAGLLLNPAAKRGLKPQEIAELEKVVKGGAVTNFARSTANLLGGGGGLGQVVTGAIAGGAVGAGAGVVPGLIVGTGIAGSGRLLKGLENQLTKRRMRRVDDQVRSRAPMGRQQEVVGLRPKSFATKAITSNALAPGQGTFSRRDSMAHAESVLGADVLAHIKKSPNTRIVFGDWLKARHTGQGVEEATQMLAGAIFHDLGIQDPAVYDQIISELNQTQGP